MRCRPPGCRPWARVGDQGEKGAGVQPACRGVQPLAADLGSARAPHPTRTRGVPASDPGSTCPACQGLGLTASGTCTSCLRADISHARYLQVSRLRRRGTNHGKCRVLAIRMSPCSATSLATWPEVKGSGRPPPHPEPGSKLPRRATTSLDAAGMRGHPGPTQSLPWGPGVRVRSALSHPASDPAPRPGLPCSPPGLSPWLLLLCCQMKTNPEADGETLVQEKAPCGGSAAVSETPQRLAPARKRERGVPGPRGDAGQAGGAERGPPASVRPRPAVSGFREERARGRASHCLRLLRQGPWERQSPTRS